jgi:hypothetical protein
VAAISIAALLTATLAAQNAPSQLVWPRRIGKADFIDLAQIKSEGLTLSV